MNALRLFLAAVACLSPLAATEDALHLVPLPLDTLQGEITVADVPFIIGKSLPESAFQAIGLPYIPPSISFNEPDDINLASVAGIKVSSTLATEQKYKIELNYGEVGTDHQTDELLGAVLDCVFRVAESDDGYELEVAITHLDSKSPLHASLKRLLEAKRKQEK